MHWTSNFWIFLFLTHAAFAFPSLEQSVRKEKKLPKKINVTEIIGEVKLYAGNASHLPMNWMLCHGQALSRTEYAALFSVIGESFGSGDGQNTFNLPDLRGRLVMGRDPHQVRSNNAVSMGHTGGRGTHTLSIDQLPVHSHESGSLNISANGLHRHHVLDPGHDHRFNYGHWDLKQGNIPINTLTDNDDFSKDTMAEFIGQSRTNITVESAGNHSHPLTGETNRTGNNEPFSLLNPYQILNYIICTSIINAQTDNNSS